MAQIVALQAQLLVFFFHPPPTADKCSFTRSLTVGSEAMMSTLIQNYLICGGHLSVSATGYFGSLMAATVAWPVANGVTPTIPDTSAQFREPGMTA